MLSQSCHGRMTGLVTLGMIGLGLPAAAQGQTIEQELSRTAAADNIGKGFQTIAVLGQTPGTSSTTLHGDDANIETYKLHLQHRFTRRDFTGRVIASPFVEVTLGGADARQAILSAPGRPDPYRLDLKFRSRSLLVGGGVVVPVSATTRITPMLIAGSSSLRIDGNYSGANAATVNRFFDGLLNNARIRSAFVGPAIQADHRRMVFRGSRLTAVARYNHIFNFSDKVTNPGLRPRGSVGVGTLFAKVDTPTRLYIGEREVFAGAFARGTAITGAERKQFGFDHYGEVGGTLVLDYPTERGIGFGIYGSALRGRGVRGHSLGITVRFAGVSAAGPS